MNSACGTCGEPFAADARFCGECGSAVHPIPPTFPPPIAVGTAVMAPPFPLTASAPAAARPPAPPDPAGSLFAAAPTATAPEPLPPASVLLAPAPEQSVAEPAALRRGDVSAALAQGTAEEQAALRSSASAALDLLERHVPVDEAVRCLTAGGRHPAPPAPDCAVAVTDRRVLVVTPGPGVISVQLASITSVFVHRAGALRYTVVEGATGQHRFTVLGPGAERFAERLRTAFTVAVLSATGTGDDAVGDRMDDAVDGTVGDVDRTGIPGHHSPPFSR